MIVSKADAKEALEFLESRAGNDSKMAEALATLGDFIYEATEKCGA